MAAAWVGYAEAGQAALREAGYVPERDTNPDRYFGRFVRTGMRAESVAAAMPRASAIERYVVEVAGADSMLVERYVYRRWPGRWPVDVYYRPGGVVADLYAWDHASLKNGRRVTEEEARAWLLETRVETIPRLR